MVRCGILNEKRVMRTNFYNKKDRVLTDYIPFTEDEFIKTMLEKKPKEIFHSFYSSDKPCWVITEYVDEKTIKYYSNSWADKTPIKVELINFYKYLSNQGLQKCSFEN